jgi:N-acetylneuraminate lyase
MEAMRGILPAVITPFDERGRFARRPFEQLLDRLHGAGVHGVYVCGTTGEGMLQSVASRCAVTEAAVAGTPRGRSVVVHVGASAFEDVRTLAMHAAGAGAHAVSSLPPAGPGMGFAEARRYYEALAACSPLPVIVYYFPDAYPAISTRQQIEELCALPNVIGVKFTDFDLSTLAGIAAPDRVVLNGRDEVLAAGLLMGAHGGIGSFYNLVPERFVEIHALAQAGRWDEARARQDEVNALITATLRFPLFPAIKQLLTWSGIPCGECLLPRGTLTAVERESLRLGVRSCLPTFFTI